MHGRPRERHALAGKLSQRRYRQIRTCNPDPACGRTPDAAHAHRRSSPGPAKGKDDVDLVGKIVASDCGSFGETRANNLIFESARLFHVAAVQQLRRSAQLPELQRRAHLSSACGTIELSLVRAYGGCAKKMSS